MNLKDLTRSHQTHNGAITWWLIPYSTLKDNHVYEAFSKVVPVAEWSDTANTFFALEAKTVDVEFAESENIEVKRFRHYWTQRPGTMAERWDAFCLLAGSSILDAFLEAYNATRDRQVEDAPIDTDKEPNFTPPGAKN